MKLAIIGFGNIGSGIEELVYINRERLNNVTGKNIEIKTVLVKNIEKDRKYFDKNLVFTDDFNVILNDSEIDTIVEVTATEDEAYEYISKAFKAGKNVVTANKAVVSKYYEELRELSLKENVNFLYEASVGGGIHIIKSILEDLPFNNITKVNGILNGTCNFILTEMASKKMSFENALKKAQELGYAEPDPSADIRGMDTLRKIRILATLIFNSKVNESNIFSFGIEKVISKDIKFLSQNSYYLKLLGEAEYINNKYYCYVLPVAVDINSKFFNIENSTNIISYQGSTIGEVSFVGAGAGKKPTVDAILRDLLDIMNKTAISNNILITENLPLSNMDLVSKFYLRISKKYSSLVTGIESQKIEDENNLYIFTKNIKLKKVLDIISNLDDKNYFFAKLESEV
ncbi:homoserine dehydrogenase [Peptoniphilus olsenii]|uniref:Homoserine dehydrogenase n=1 Tax=Peptoniphilus olsenii TaxID=411570 RepID=A0ABV2J7L1_9FIRM